MSVSNKSLSVYRHFLRSIKAAFRGDDFMLASARQEVRTRFQSAAGVTDPDEIDKLCAEGRDAAQFLTQYVVQAKLNDRGNFAMTVEPHHTETMAEEAALRPDRSQA